MLPLKNRSWILKNSLLHDVNVTPSVITGREESVRYVEIDSNNIILDVTKFRIVPLLYFILFIFTAKWFYDEARGEDIFIIVGLAISIVSILIAAISLAWFIFYKKKYVAFNRNRGIVSIPGPFWCKNVEVPFKDVVAVIRRETHYYAHLNVLNLYRPDGFKADVGINTQDLDTLQNDWAFYVWYMDKSRPLPPSPVFDAYRDSSNISPALGNAP